MNDKPALSLWPSPSTGIQALEADHREIVSFDADARRRRQDTIRATAMVFEDPASLALRRDLDRIAPSEATVLIVGETGAGKELAARYIHARSARASGPFVAVNCGALSDSLAEAELFGYEKGAFTGALKTQLGWFETARGGTLMLDEIGDLPLALQVKLLRVLQEREVVRVGSRRPVQVDIRVVAATNVDLEAAVKAKHFREDLYFRLNVASVRLPPLRKRPADIEPLAHYFLDLYRERLRRTDLTFGAQAMKLLQRHSWPGNIRELENVIHNAILLAEGPVIEAADLRLTSGALVQEAEPTDLEGELRRLVERAIVNGEPEILDRTIRCAVRAAFEMADGNQVRAAESLGVTRNAFRTHLSHLGVIPRRGRNGPAKIAAKPSALRIGFQKYGTLSLLKARGALERRLAAETLEVSWEEFAAGPQLLDALNQGRIDFCATGDAPPIFAQAAGTRFSYVGHEPPAPSSEALIVSAGSAIRKIADLRGRKVALNRGSNVHYLLVRILDAHGLSIDDIDPVFLPPNELLSGLRTGAIDAGMVWDPLLPAAQFQGGARVLVDGVGLVANRQFYLAGAAFAREQPGAIEILMDELQAVGEYAAQHRLEMARLMAAEISIDVEALEVALGRLTFGAKPLNEGVIGEQQEIADTLHAAGILQRSISVREAVWPRAYSDQIETI
jgi:aliphatic sulfonates family ABC transporter substrate-binding protein